MPELNIFGDDVQANHGEQFPEVQEVDLEQGNGAPPRLNWTPLMSAFVLEKFHNLVAEGVRTDKGFKYFHLNPVAKELQAFIHQPVTRTQVYNHLRKWRTKWVRVCNLKDLNGANWDEDMCMITLDPSHYNGHVKDYSKDAEFLNVPIVNYNFMQTVFGCGVVTGRFAMGSNEALGEPTEPERIDLDADDDTKPVGSGKKPKYEAGPSTKPTIEDSKQNKKKKGITEEDAALFSSMTNAVNNLGATISAGNHNEAAPGIYEAVMSVPDFARSDKMLCLNHLMENKGTALVFVGMDPLDKILWIETHLAKVRSQMAFQ